MTQDPSSPRFESHDETAVRVWLATFPQDTPMIVIPIDNAFDDVIECVEGICASIPDDVPLLLFDDGSTDGRIEATLAPLAAKRRFLYLRRPRNDGFSATMNFAFAWSRPRDVILVQSGVVVPPEWLERLCEAAQSQATIATATPLTNSGLFLSVPYRNQPIPYVPRGMTVEQADARVRASAQRIYPVIPTAVGHCVYFKRMAFDVVGYFDTTLSGYAELTDFSQRAVMAGFRNVAVDDVFVFHKGSRSFKAATATVSQQTHERSLAVRYPWYRAWSLSAKRTSRSPIALALESASRALLGQRIAIDATCVGDALTGTELNTLELIRAMVSTPHRHTHLTMIVSDTVQKVTLRGVDTLVDEVVRVSELEKGSHQPFDLVHRPWQIHHEHELDFLRKISRRYIVTQLDFIMFSSPSYFPATDAWMHHQYVTQRTFSSADGVIYLSNDVARDAVQQGMVVPGERTCVVYPGVDHQVLDVIASPPDVPEIHDGPFLLMLGNGFKHKNRTFAVRLFRELALKHRWKGRLVIAGSSALSGGSGPDEALEHLGSPELRARIHYIGYVSDAEKKWLLENAALVLYPSIVEGFGFVPFEAAAVGTPALTARTTSLGEVLGDDMHFLDTFDPAPGAQHAMKLLSDPLEASRQVERINERAANFTWRRAAETTWAFYERVFNALPRSYDSDRATPYIIAYERSLKDLGRLDRAYRHLYDAQPPLHEAYRRLHEEHEHLNVEYRRLQDTQPSIHEAYQCIYEENTRLHDEYRRLFAEHQRLQDTQPSIHEACQDLHEENTRLRDEYQRLQDAQRPITEAYQSLHDEHHRLQNELQPLQQQVREIEAEYQRLEEWSGVLRERVASIERARVYRLLKRIRAV